MSHLLTTVRPATGADRPVIANLVQLYLYDMTEFQPFPIGRDGRFDYGFLDRFWQHPYLLFAGDDLAGFALIVDQSPITAADRYFMAEFFVMKAYRGQGFGRATVAEIFRRHPGAWQIGVLPSNTAALAFWTRILTAHGPTVQQCRFDGEDWRLHDFVVGS